jgi:hypothetical protein
VGDYRGKGIVADVAHAKDTEIVPRHLASKDNEHPNLDAEPSGSFMITNNASFDYTNLIDIISITHHHLQHHFHRIITPSAFAYTSIHYEIRI